MVISTAEGIRLLLAVVVGGAIGLERELHHKSAGFRTITLICIGATLFTMLDIRLNASGRIIANIVTGVGFLGAGVILHDTSRIKGLTTAASIWISAALGVAIGVGAYFEMLVVAVLVLVVMTVFNQLERRVNDWFNLRHYQMVLEGGLPKAAQVEALMRSHGLRLGLSTQMKENGQFVCTWDASGTEIHQNEFVRTILQDPEVKSVTW
jgi:putative Mg2+ transporter-C (MgtC) family protein